MQWKNPLAKNSFYDLVVYYLLFLVLITMGCSFRYGNSVSLILLVGIPLVSPRNTTYLKNAFRSVHFLACLALVLISLAGLLYTNFPQDNWTRATREAGILAAPFLFSTYASLNDTKRKFLIKWFGIALALVSIISLGYASWQYGQFHDSSVFFYHDLLKLFSQHAVHFSFFLFICIVCWMEHDIATSKSKTEKYLLILLTAFFSFMMFMLSSKTLIVITVCYFIYFLGRQFFSKNSMSRRWMIGALFVALTSIVVFTNNPIKKRFLDVSDRRTMLFEQDHFNQGIYFNGVQFRLLLWRFSYQILNKHHAWVFGVSPGDGQHELNQRMIDSNMYQGDGDFNKGYLGYNCHNQYVQTTLQSGIIGLVFFLIAIGSLFVMSVRQRNSSAAIIVCGLIIFCFTEAILEAQYGLVIFNFVPLLLLASEKKKSGKNLLV
ncbi:MAG: hypothetical protein C5B52_15540 [Bacteroidetes bacterium]|nr:MAG: hypothetical protein C5B52_15540 [Bacteroidota bacterium]